MLRRGAFVEQKHRLTQVLLDHAIADKAIAYAGHDCGLVDLLGDLHDGDQHILGGLFPAHDFQELHHIGRAEKVHPDHVLRTPGEGCNPVDVEGRCVRGEDGASFCHRVELLEHRLLHGHVLEYRLDNQIAGLDVVVGQRRLEQRHILLDLFRGELAALDGTVVILAYGRHTLVERLLFRFQDGDGDPGAQKVHRDAATHGASADDGNARDLACRRILGHVGDLRRRTLGEKCMAQRPRLRRLHQLREKLALELEAFFERYCHGSGNRIDALEWSGEVLRERSYAVPGKLEKRVGVRKVDFHVAQARERPAVCDDLTRKRQRTRQQLIFQQCALDDFVDEPGAFELLGRHRCA